MNHHQWTHEHNGHRTACRYVNTGAWGSSHFELATGDHVTTVVREPQEADYRRHLRRAGIDTTDLVIPVQLRHAENTDARECISCGGWYPAKDFVRVAKGNPICSRCTALKKAAVRQENGA